MKYIPEDWEIKIHSYRPEGMSVVQPKGWVEFRHVDKDIIIRYGESRFQIKNKEVIIKLIELL